MYVRRFAQVRVKTKLRCAVRLKGCLFKGSSPALRLTTRPHFDRIAGPKCYASIQFVNQSGNSPNSSPHFLREFGSLTGNRFLSLCTWLYCVLVHCAECTLWRGRWNLLRFFIKVFHANTHHVLYYKYGIITLLMIWSSNDTSEFDETWNLLLLLPDYSPYEYIE